MERAPLDDVADDTDVSFVCMVQQAKDQLQNSPTQPRLSTEPNFEFLRSGSMSPSPADLLFSDGQLLPHSYPVNNPTRTSKSSPTSSLSSNTTSRSSSINSSSSSGCAGGGSARRCLRKNSERVAVAVPKRVSFQLSPGVEGRWQLPGPGLVTPNSVRSCSERYGAKVGRGKARARKEAGKPQRGLFGSIVSACRECHALEPSKVVDNGNDKMIAT